MLLVVWLLLTLVLPSVGPCPLARVSSFVLFACFVPCVRTHRKPSPGEKFRILIGKALTRAGLFAPGKVPTAENPADFLGKLVGVTTAPL